MTTQNFSHQENIFSPNRARPVCIFGAGSVGGYVALFLAQMGVENITVWDDDIVDSHNVPMSVYRPKDILKSKVEVLRDIVLENTGTSIHILREMYTGQHKLKNISVVSCVDTMSARKVIWEQVKLNPSIDIFCDTRLASAYIEVLSINPNKLEDIKHYEELLFDDEDAAPQLCGRHGIVLSTSRAALVTAANLTSYWQTGVKKLWHKERCDRLQEVV